jgi:hypothetical protein
LKRHAWAGFYCLPNVLVRDEHVVGIVDETTGMHLTRRRQEVIWVSVWLMRLGLAALRMAARRIWRSLASAPDPLMPSAGSVVLPRHGSLRAADFRPVSEPGFGDRWNTYPWSMLWWRGRLYVGTNRAFPCVEYFQMHARFPRLQRYPPRAEPDITCTPCVYDLPLQAELWCYSPESGIWERVYQSPAEVEVPGRPGIRIARDIGYRNMIAFREPDGTEALYVAGVGARTITRRHEVPHLLRSTDGRTFAALPSAPGTALGQVDAVGFRAMAVFDERLFVVAGSLYGAGALLESADPRRGGDSFRTVSPPGMLVNELAIFDGYLYAGLRHPLRGYAVVRTAAAGEPPYSFQTVVPHGAYRRVMPSHCVLSMKVFDGCLYVGTSNPAEVVRIHADGRWDLVAGAARRTPLGLLSPLSGMGDGFGNPLNVNISRLEVHDGWLYAGTFNVASKQRRLPVVGRLNRAYQGFDLLATADGVRWHTVTRSGLDGEGNTVRTLASTPFGLFLGANEERHGARVYLARARAADASGDVAPGP